jgi:hypothetical protein
MSYMIVSARASKFSWQVTLAMKYVRWFALAASSESTFEYAPRVTVNCCGEMTPQPRKQCAAVKMCRSLMMDPAQNCPEYFLNSRA